MTDIRMPIMDGVDFVREIKRRYPNIPVIVMTVHGESDWLDEARAVGAVACLPKPFIAPQLVQTLQAIGLAPAPNPLAQPTL
jgi:CheY-like chemotaxis protein